MCLRLVGNVSGVCTVHNLLVGCLFTACLSEQIKWEWYLSHVSIYTVSYFSFCYFYYVVKNMLCWNVESLDLYIHLYLFIYAFMLHSSHVNTFFPSALLFNSTPTGNQRFSSARLVLCSYIPVHHDSYIQFDPKFHVCQCTCSTASWVSPQLCQMQCLF